MSTFSRHHASERLADPRPADAEALARFRRTRIEFTFGKLRQHADFFRYRIVPLLDLHSRLKMQRVCRFFNSVLSRPDGWERLANVYRLPHIPPIRPPSDPDWIEPYHFETEQLVLRSFVAQKTLRRRRIELTKTIIECDTPDPMIFSEMVLLPGGRYTLGSVVDQNGVWRIYMFSVENKSRFSRKNVVAVHLVGYTRPFDLSAKYMIQDSDHGIMISYCCRFDRNDPSKGFGNPPCQYTWKTEKDRNRYSWRANFTRLCPIQLCFDPIDLEKPRNSDAYLFNPEYQPAPFQSCLEPDVFVQLEGPTLFCLDGTNYAAAIAKPRDILLCDLTHRRTGLQNHEALDGMYLHCLPNAPIPGLYTPSFAPRRMRGRSIHIHAMRILPHQRRILAISAGEVVDEISGETHEVFFAELYIIPPFQAGAHVTLAPVERRNFSTTGIVDVKISDLPVAWTTEEIGPPPPVSIHFSTQAFLPTTLHWAVWPTEGDDSSTGYVYHLKDCVLQGLRWTSSECKLTSGTNCALAWSTESLRGGVQTLYIARHVYPRIGPEDYPDHLRRALKVGPFVPEHEVLGKHNRAQELKFDCTAITALAFDEFSGRIAFSENLCTGIFVLDLTGSLDLLTRQKRYKAHLKLEEAIKLEELEAAERAYEEEYEADEAEISQYLLDPHCMDDETHLHRAMDEEEEWIEEVARIRRSFEVSCKTEPDLLEGERDFRRDEDFDHISVIGEDEDIEMEAPRQNLCRDADPDLEEDIEMATPPPDSEADAASDIADAASDIADAASDIADRDGSPVRDLDDF